MFIYTKDPRDAVSLPRDNFNLCDELDDSQIEFEQAG